MTQKIPQFYQRWVRNELGIPESSAFAYHKGEQYAYLVMGGPEDAPGNLFILALLDPDKGMKKREPEFLKMHRIQASEVSVDSDYRLMATLEKVVWYWLANFRNFLRSLRKSVLFGSTA